MLGEEAEQDGGVVPGLRTVVHGVLAVDRDPGGGGGRRAGQVAQPRRLAEHVEPARVPRLHERPGAEGAERPALLARHRLHEDRDVPADGRAGPGGGRHTGEQRHRGTLRVHRAPPGEPGPVERGGSPPATVSRCTLNITVRSRGSSGPSRSTRLGWPARNAGSAATARRTGAGVSSRSTAEGSGAPSRTVVNPSRSAAVAYERRAAAVRWGAPGPVSSGPAVGVCSRCSSRPVSTAGRGTAGTGPGGPCRGRAGPPGGRPPVRRAGRVLAPQALVRHYRQMGFERVRPR